MQHINNGVHPFLFLKEHIRKMKTKSMLSNIRMELKRVYRKEYISNSNTTNRIKC